VVVLAIVILLGVIKKLLKLVLVVSAILVLWVAYMVWSDQDVTVDRLKEGIESGVKTVKEKASETSEKVKESISKKVEEKTDEKMKNAIPKNGK